MMAQSQEGQTIGKWILITASACILISLAWWKGMFLPHWIHWNDKAMTCMHDSETIVLTHKRLSIEKDDQKIWELNPDWLVSDVQLGDIDQDGADEMLVLAWRHGKFGRYHPIYEKDDPYGWYEHLYIYDLVGYEEPHARWMSSALMPLIKSFNITADGIIECTAPDNEKTKWHWENRGIYRIDLEKEALE